MDQAMDNRSINNNPQQSSLPQDTQPYLGQRWLIEERDACGVGFIASQAGHASHQLLEQALAALACLEHRGGCSADRDSGDGAGIMTAIPWELFNQWFDEQGIKRPSVEKIGVGMVFLPQEETKQNIARKIVEEVLAAENIHLLGWREVPVKPVLLGIQARENQPKIEQLLVLSPDLQG